METIKLIEKLKTYPLFTINDLAKILQKRPEYVRTIAYRLRKKKLIFAIEKGKYTCYEDPLIYATHIYTPAYISLWTALRFYNLTEQLPKTVFVMLPKVKENLKEIIFTKTRHFWGYKKGRYRDFTIFIADKEKAVVDSLLSGKVPLDEIIKAIESKELNIKKLINYAKKTKSKALAKRLGFLLEERGYKCNLSIDNNYISLDISFKKKGKKNKRWKIIDNRR